MASNGADRDGGSLGPNPGKILKQLQNLFDIMKSKSGFEDVFVLDVFPKCGHPKVHSSFDDLSKLNCDFSQKIVLQKCHHETVKRCGQNEAEVKHFSFLKKFGPLFRLFSVFSNKQYNVYNNSI